MGRLYLLLGASSEGKTEFFKTIAYFNLMTQALQTKPSGINDVPHTVIVAKRLAQCLDPILPSGVHQKALEVYSCVFSILGVCLFCLVLFTQV